MIYAFSFLLLLLGAILNQAGLTIYTTYFWIIIVIIILLMVVLEIWADQGHQEKENKPQ